uniref:Nodule Cysteine-Rich (NCR) secreted peptide n=1 Tax=Heterorhabditis bacteriophora TaxID=37862 RepID=A0A1I7XHY9_HETBA
MSVAFVLFMSLSILIESAKHCYSGSKDNYKSQPCDTGVDGMYVCQKFTCEGGKCEYNIK